jgi:hypothetical protein
MSNIVKVKDGNDIVHLMSLRTWVSYCERLLDKDPLAKVVTENPPISCIECIIKKT